MSSLRGGEQRYASVRVENRVTLLERRGSSGSGSVVGQGSMSFVPCVANAFMKLRGRWKDAPICVGFCDLENIEVMLNNESPKTVVLGMRRRFGKPAEILEAQAKCVVQFQSGGGAPRAVGQSSIVLVCLRWEMVPTRLEDV